jgi:hypothetical protein
MGNKNGSRVSHGEKENCSKPDSPDRDGEVSAE